MVKLHVNCARETVACVYHKFIVKVSLDLSVFIQATLNSRRHVAWYGLRWVCVKPVFVEDSRTSLLRRCSAQEVKKRCRTKCEDYPVMLRLRFWFHFKSPLFFHIRYFSRNNYFGYILRLASGHIQVNHYP